MKKKTDFYFASWKKPFGAVSLASGPHWFPLVCSLSKLDPWSLTALLGTSFLWKLDIAISSRSHITSLKMEWVLVPTFQGNSTPLFFSLSWEIFSSLAALASTPCLALSHPCCTWCDLSELSQEERLYSNNFGTCSLWMGRAVLILLLVLPDSSTAGKTKQKHLYKLFCHEISKWKWPRDRLLGSMPINGRIGLLETTVCDMRGIIPQRGWWL